MLPFAALPSTVRYVMALQAAAPQAETAPPWPLATPSALCTFAELWMSLQRRGCGSLRLAVPNRWPARCSRAPPACRFKSLQKRALIEPRRKIEQKKQGKKVEYIQVTAPPHPYTQLFPGLCDAMEEAVWLWGGT